MAKTLTKMPIMAVRTTTGAPPSSMTVAEGLTNSMAAGEIGLMDAAGEFSELSGNTPAQIYGVARKAASTVEATDYPVWLADPTTLFEGTLLQGSAADHVAVQADLGTVMGIQRVTADSKVYLDSSVTDGANARVFVHALAKDSALGDTNVRVLFTFLPKFVQHLATS